MATAEQQKTSQKVRVATRERALGPGSFGPLAPYACPDCQGVLSAIIDGDIMRYWYHTGHAHSADSLLAILTEKIGNTLWSATRGVEESHALLNSLGDH